MLLHFVAPRASAICEPHKAEVAAAAERLGTTVRECDIDAEPDLARRYNVLNVARGSGRRAIPTPWWWGRHRRTNS